MKKKMAVSLLLTSAAALAVCSCSAQKQTLNTTVGTVAPTVSAGAVSQPQESKEEQCFVPVIRSISILDENGAALKQNAGWLLLEKTVKIRVEYTGAADCVLFYTIPTGTETVTLQKCIGAAYPAAADSSAELVWQAPEGFLGYVYVMVFREDAARQSVSVNAIREA